MRDDELQINAKDLSNPGPRIMVESALTRERRRWIRVIVSGDSSIPDLKEYFTSLGALRIEVDQLGADYHVIVDLGAQGDDKT